MKPTRISWKQFAIIGAIGTGAGLGLAAGDNYFEIGKNLEIFNELYKELNIYYVDETNPGDLIPTGTHARTRFQLRKKKSNEWLTAARPKKSATLNAEESPRTVNSSRYARVRAETAGNGEASSV